jgi:hypothetical protein
MISRFKPKGYCDDIPKRAMGMPGLHLRNSPPPQGHHRTPEHKKQPPPLGIPYEPRAYEVAPPPRATI